MAGSQTIGIVGGGQLGRMLTLAALPLGFKVVVINPSPNSPAAQAGAQEIIGDLYDQTALEELSRIADFITVEIEHLDAGVLEKIAAQGTPVNPAPQTIRLIQDKFKQKEFLQAAGIPVAPFAGIEGDEDAHRVLHELGHAIILKTRHGAYDGRGNALVKSPQELKGALERFEGRQLYGEQIVPFRKELAVMVARSMSGDIQLYPIVETVHKRNICLETYTPAAISETELREAKKVALKVAQHLEGAGVFGIEMFLTDDGNVLVNEIAPRVHNSGHYTMDACRTSQFEQHVRAVTGLPLGSTHMVAPAAVMINVLGERDGPTELTGLDEVLKVPHTSVHMYGKSPTKIDRKMGHITATGDTLQQARTRARQARKKLQI
jgi:5-(carboxyamino)imidazole ribonucleotide synthase